MGTRGANTAKAAVAILLIAGAGYYAFAKYRQANPYRAPAPPPDPELYQIEWPGLPLFHKDGSLNLAHRSGESGGSIASSFAALGPTPPELEALAKRDGPKLLVYNLFDATKDGVHQFVLQSWHPTASLLLSTRTTAHPIGVGVPGRMAILPAGEAKPPAERTPEWIAACIERDPQVPEGVPVLAGRYVDADGGTTTAEFFWLADKSSPPQPLHAVPGGNPAAPMSMFDAQRAAALGLGDALKAKGVAPRPPAGLPKSLLDDQLARILVASRAIHTAPVYEAANRSILLATAFPDSAAPMTAACAALQAIDTAAYEYCNSASILRQALGLRTLALAQAAVAAEPESPSAKTVLFAIPAGYGVIPGPQMHESHAPPSIQASWTGPSKLSRNQFDYSPEDFTPLGPLQFMAGFVSQLWYMGTQSAMVPAAKSLLMRYAESDYMSFALFSIARFAPGYESQTAVLEAAGNTMSSTTTDFAASSAIFAAEQGLEAEFFRLAAPLGWDLPQIRKAASARDFATVRSLVDTHAASDDDEAPLQFIKGTTALLNPRTGNPAETSSSAISFSSGFRYFLHREALAFGPEQEGAFIGEWRGENESLREMHKGLEGYLEGVDTYRLVRYSQLDTVNEKEKSNLPEHAKAARALHEAMPEDLAMRLEVAVDAVKYGSPDATALVEDGLRALRGASTVRSALAETFESVGCIELAVQNYEAAYSAGNFSFQIRNRYNLLKDTLGDMSDRSAEFLEGAEARHGNGSLWNDLVHHLMHLKKFDEARSLIAKHKALFAGNGFNQFLPVDVEVEDGQTSRALELLKSMNSSQPLNPAVTAAFLATRIRYYVMLGDLSGAQADLKIAEAIDSWRGDVIRARLVYDRATKNWAGVRAAAEKSASRYYSTAYTESMIALADWHLGQRDEARRRMEDYFRNTPDDPSCGMMLMWFYAEIGDAARVPAKKLIEYYIAHPKRSRSDLVEILAEYKRIDAAAADGYASRLNDIMRGPKTLEEFAAMVRPKFE